MLLNDFESGRLGNWVAGGEAFDPSPLRDGISAPLPLKAYTGSGLAGSLPGRETKTGTLTSPEFQIKRDYINFQIWGQRHLSSVVGVELLLSPAQAGAEPEAVRAACATEAFDPTRTLHWRTFDVRNLSGRNARLRINDWSTSGAVAVDSFLQSDSPKAAPTDASHPFCETYRPQFHFTARSGWLNDANGLLHYRGTWHLFHQHRPPGAEATVWGHATSADLLHWRHRETAISNETTTAMFSGSGLVDWENVSGLKRGCHPPLLLFYTRHPKSDSGEKATQCLALSADGGQTFEKFPGNPLLQTRDRVDRDPKVFYHRPGRSWIMVLSLSRNNTNRDHATYGLFRSRDLTSWELLQEIGPGAWYWECPDLFEMPLDGDPARSKWVLSKGSGDYIVGIFDGEQFRPETPTLRTHWGACYYGAQTFSDAPSGRRIQLAWMNSGSKSEAPNAFPGMPFNQQMSFPRELTLRTTPDGPRLFRKPIAEIAQLWRKTHASKAIVLLPGQNALEGNGYELLDLEVELDPSQARELVINLRGAEIVYNVPKAKLGVSGRSLDLPLNSGRLNLRILLDRTSYELFANGGALTHSHVFFPETGNRRISLECQGGPVPIHRLEVRELGSIWEKGREPN